MGFWNTLFNLRNGEDEKVNVLKNIKANISFKGSNLWILACAIVIASVGLNVNSTAVIIGAMLISPLMGPIVGAGFALGMFDFPLLQKSLLNLLIATIVGLLVSALYFILTPFKDAQSEILARTAPNIYDVLIAFFGGLVGVIAVTRVEKGNPIPGVAIATALMPPLCTAGYGIATGNLSFFAGALFLYTINCTFICISTYFIVKLLKYPAVAIETKRQKRIHLLISSLIILIMVPSVYFAYVFYKEQQFKKNVSVFITREFEDKGNTVIYKRSNYLNNPKTVELAFLIRKFSEQEIASLNKRLPAYQLFNTKLIIRQDSTYLAENRQKMELDNERASNEQNIVERLQNELSSYQLNTVNLYKEASALFPKLSSISVANMHVLDSTGNRMPMTTVIYKTADRGLTDSDEKMLADWLKSRLSVDSIEVYQGK
jgi:uncharacterized hydrophobic protein (TIGR00271 family)